MAKDSAAVASVLRSARGIGGGPRPATTIRLGERVRQLRQTRDWTLDEAAKHTQLAASTLSKIENDHMSPTFDVVQKLAIGFGIDITELFASSPTQASSGRRSITRAGSGRPMETPVYAHRLLAAELVNKRILPFETRITARSLEEFGQWPSHGGEEFFYVVSGEVTLYTEHYEPETLSAGDSAYIDSNMGHACISTSAEDAIVLWINTGD